eukprot:scpid27413/ scgid23637/ 
MVLPSTSEQRQASIHIIQSELRRLRMPTACDPRLKLQIGADQGQSWKNSRRARVRNNQDFDSLSGAHVHAGRRHKQAVHPTYGRAPCLLRPFAKVSSSPAQKHAHSRFQRTPT